MACLNEDCWRVIFDQLKPETRTLYSCLFVSKAFFALSCEVLYSRPLKVHAGQQEFSSFSKRRLENLLDICSGFITPSPPIFGSRLLPRLPTPGTSSLSSSPATPQTTLASASFSEHPFHSRAAIHTIIPRMKNQPFASPTTINYYELVMEYPPQMVVRREVAQCQEYLTCYSRTIPILHVAADDFDGILPLVSKFQSLQTLYVSLPAPKMSTLAPLSYESVTRENLDIVLRFIILHHQAFPGLLAQLNTCSLLKEWKELAVVQKAMGGMVNQTIEISRPIGQDLTGLIVSRLKYLTLSSLEHNNGLLETMVMDVLKNCRVLETLELKWPHLTMMNFDLLSDEVPRPSQSSNIIRSSQFSDGIMGLKQLVVWGNPRLTVQAMKFFKDTLESVQVRSLDGSHSNLILDWQSSFQLPKLKSIEIDELNFKLENLSCCPSLESLVITNAGVNDGISGFWSAHKLIIPFTTIFESNMIQKLELTGNGSAGVDFRQLKSLIHLEDLHLDTHGIIYYRCFMIQLSEMDPDWWFPNLRRVVLYGRFALAVQGQILWLAPKLEHLTLDFWIEYQPGPMDTDTFLYPPSALDFKSLSTTRLIGWPWDMPITPAMISPTSIPPSPPRCTSKAATTASIFTSKACFPALKSLKLSSFKYPKFETATAFADVFFGYQKVTVHTETKIVGDCLFPNLEKLELVCRWPHEDLQPCVLQAMRNLPKLEYVRYHEPRLVLPGYSRYDILANWLQEVPQDRMGKDHANYRNRPVAAVNSNKIQGSGNARCVVEYDRPEGVRYQLNPSSVGKIKATGERVWERLVKPDRRR